MSYDDLKIPPHSVPAEQSVIGGLLLAGLAQDGTAWMRVHDRVSEADFYRQDHRLLFRAITDLAANGKPLDLLTISEWLKERNELENAGGFSYLATMAKDTPSAANIRAYADIVRNNAIRRSMIATCTRLIEAAYKADTSESGIRDLIESGVAAMFALEQDSSDRDAGLKIIKPFIKAVIAEKEEAIRAYVAGEKKLKGIPTGIESLDRRWSGLEPGRVYTFAGRPSMGKSALALQVADYVSQFFLTHGGGYFVAIFSLEMPEHELVDRLIACSGRADYGRLREPWRLEKEDWACVSQGVKQLGGSDLYLDCATRLKVSHINQRVRRIQSESKKKPGLVVLDHLQLMSGEKKAYANDNAEMSDITRDIKRLAKDMHVPIIQLSQLNRGVENRQNKRPVLGDLRESGSIEQDTDFALFLYRESQYDTECGHNDVELHTAKGRAAKLGTDIEVWVGHQQRFERRALAGDYQQRGKW